MIKTLLTHTLQDAPCAPINNLDTSGLSLVAYARSRQYRIDGLMCHDPHMNAVAVDGVMNDADHRKLCEVALQSWFSHFNIRASAYSLIEELYPAYLADTVHDMNIRRYEVSGNPDAGFGIEIGGVEDHRYVVVFFVKAGYRKLHEMLTGSNVVSEQAAIPPTATHHLQ